MSFTCKAAITSGDGNFFIDTIEVGEPASDEVLVRLTAAGICHTDYDSLRWGRQIILGHEGSGIVVKTGSQVKNFQAGDRVMLNWAIPCGECFQCLEGNEHICEKNSPVTAGNQVSAGHAHAAGSQYQNKPIPRSFNLGTLSEYTLVKEAAVVKNHSARITDAAAAIIGCGVMTGYGSVMNAAKIKAGSSVVVLGAGGVGMNVIQSAKLAGAAMIIAIDINPVRFQMAEKFGATVILQADPADKGLLNAAAKVKTMTGGRGADYAFECTAIPELGAAPLAMIRNAGMAIAVSGIEQEIVIDMNLFEWDKIYINPLYGKCRPRIDFPKIIEHYEKGELMIEEMVSSTYPLTALQQAFADMLSGKNAKGVIVF